MSAETFEFELGRIRLGEVPAIIEPLTAALNKRGPLGYIVENIDRTDSRQVFNQVGEALGEDWELQENIDTTGQRRNYRRYASHELYNGLVVATLIGSESTRSGRAEVADDLAAPAEVDELNRWDSFNNSQGRGYSAGWGVIQRGDALLHSTDTFGRILSPRFAGQTVMARVFSRPDWIERS